MNYFVVSTGRGRSGALTGCLKQLGCGEPSDFFEGDRWDYLDDGLRGIDKILKLKRKNGYLGIRAVWHHIRQLSEKTGIGLHQFLDVYFPDARFVFVKRDILRQALEGLYIHFERRNELDQYQKNIKKIKDRVVQIEMGYEAWELFFKKRNIIPLRIKTEALVAEPERICREVCEFLDYPYPNDLQLKDSFSDRYTHLDEVNRMYNRMLEKLVCRF